MSLPSKYEGKKLKLVETVQSCSKFMLYLLITNYLVHNPVTEQDISDVQVHSVIKKIFRLCPFKCICCPLAHFCKSL